MDDRWVICFILSFRRAENEFILTSYIKIGHENSMQVLCRKCIKNGFQPNGAQHYKCTFCRRRLQDCYVYEGCKVGLKNHQIILLTKERSGIRSTARILKI